jgi:hypothetical protein
MIAVISKGNPVVIELTDKAEKIDGGMKTDSAHYFNYEEGLDFVAVKPGHEIPNDYEAGKYLYTEEGFTPNPIYQTKTDGKNAL